MLGSRQDSRRARQDECDVMTTNTDEGCAADTNNGKELLTYTGGGFPCWGPSRYFLDR
jgi:hypothetical protein